jgi:hypothetical protein
MIVAASNSRRISERHFVARENLIVHPNVVDGVVAKPAKGPGQFAPIPVLVSI